VICLGLPGELLRRVRAGDHDEEKLVRILRKTVGKEVPRAATTLAMTLSSARAKWSWISKALSQS
jgi:hypothetical protein